MKTSIAEIAPGIHRLSTLVPDVGPSGFTFNQFLVVADQPLLFHAGPRGMFPLVAEAVARVMPLDRLRWISFGHVEADECGAVNMWLNAAPRSQVAFNPLGCQVSLDDLCDRPPRPLAEGEVLDLGGRRIRAIATPHVPHGWEAQVLYEEVTGTLFCGDLLAQLGDGPAIIDGDVVGPALDAERMFHAMSMSPGTATALRSLAELAPRSLAIMHGSSFHGDGRRALLQLADACPALAAR